MSETTASPLAYEARLRERFGDAIQSSYLAVTTPTFVVDPAHLIPICQFVRDELGFRLPVLCSAIDQRDRFEVVWHVYHLDTCETLAIKVVLPHDDPRVASTTSVWKGMDWHEREAFDLMGILFEGHPDLRRILLPDDWEGHPLRKDYTAID